MHVRRTGEKLVVVSHHGTPAWILARAMNENPFPGMREAVPCWDSVGIDFEEAPAMALLTDWLNDLPLGDEPAATLDHEVHVRFDGEDISSVAQRLQLDPGDVRGLIVGAEFRVEAIGFSPGFPYMSGLPEPLCGLPRLAQPRARVPAGSFAITGDQAGIYPSATPGGWNLLGTVEEETFRAEPLWMRFRVGDRVRIREAS